MISRPETSNIHKINQIIVSNCLPHVPHLEPYSHHCGPLDVVGLGEGRSPAVGTDVPDNVLDPMVTMVPVRGGRAAPPVKAAISVNPTASASVPVRAVAMAPLGVHGCHCAAYSCVASLASLSSLSLSLSAETELSVLLARRALSSAAVATASTSALAAVSSAIASLAVLNAIAAISTAARSRSSVAATSASCRCCALKAIEH
jgi:hypothetical protein